MIKSPKNGSIKLRVVGKSFLGFCAREKVVRAEQIFAANMKMRSKFFSSKNEKV